MRDTKGAESAGIPFGRYVIRSRLGRGGMGEVFLADQLGPLGPVRPVALKRMLPQFARDRSALRLFFEEMAIAAQLNHPNIATTYDFGEFGGIYFLAMEYVEGVTLQSLLQRSGALPLAEALHVMRRVAEALAYAHALKIPGREIMPVVHSDLSPANLMLSRQGAVKLLDFGVARAEAAADKGPGHGKIAYAAPEQTRGAPPDRRFDLWSFGIVFYELLAGVRPFRGRDVLEIVEAAESKRYQRIESVRGEAALIAPIIDRALEPRPEARWPDAESLVQALESLERTLAPVGPERLAALVETAGGPTLGTDAGEMTGTGMAVPLVRALANQDEEVTPKRSPAAATIARAAPDPGHDTSPRTPRGATRASITIAAAAIAASLAIGGALWWHGATREAETEALVEFEDLPRVAEKEMEKAAKEAIAPSAGDVEPKPLVRERAPRGSVKPKSTRKVELKGARSEAEEKSERPGDLGVLSVRSVPWSRITLDGQSLGDGIVASKPVPAGKHRLVLTPGADDFPPRVVDLEIKLGVVTKVFVDFRANTVRIDPL
jgi:eukaryotic-like serine/threonine-protein kinase